MVNAQHIAVDLKQNDVGIGGVFQMAELDRFVDRPQQCLAPDFDALHECVADHAGLVIEFDGAGNEHAACAFGCAGDIQPGSYHLPESRQTLGQRQCRLKHDLLEAAVIFAHHFHQQILARLEMGKHAAFAHVCLFRQHADGDALQSAHFGHFQRRVENGGFRRIPFERFACL